MAVEEGLGIFQELTPELVEQVADSLQKSTPRYSWGKEELKNAVFEHLVDQFGLPWAETEVGQIPDYKDPRVLELFKKLGELGVNYD